MHPITKRHNRLPYKKILLLKKNVQNSNKIFKFNKQKWQKFKYTYLKHKQKNIYNPKIYFLFNFMHFFSKRFKYNLENKQRLSFFYGKIKLNLLKILITKVLKKLRMTKNQAVCLLIKKLEARLDTALYRTYFSTSFGNAKQLISHKKIFVNNKLVQHSCYKLKKGDLITFDNSIHNFIISNIVKSKVWQIPPKYFFINYKTLQILIIENINFNNYFVDYDFWIDFNSLIQFYKK